MLLWAHNQTSMQGISRRREFWEHRELWKYRARLLCVCSVCPYHIQGFSLEGVCTNPWSFQRLIYSNFSFLLRSVSVYLLFIIVFLSLCLCVSIPFFPCISLSLCFCTSWHEMVSTVSLYDNLKISSITGKESPQLPKLYGQLVSKIILSPHLIDWLTGWISHLLLLFSSG